MYDKTVKDNAGAAGVDQQTIEQFDADLMENLYKIWNRISSGSYFPPPVRAVSIPKKNGGHRILEHFPKKSRGFFDSGMLQLFDFELRPYRSIDSI